MDSLTLRKGVLNDSEFAYCVKKAAFKEYVERVWGWDEDEQRQYHERGFCVQGLQIINSAGTDVGIMSEFIGPNCLEVNQLYLFPEHQGKGIGRRCMLLIIEKGHRLGLPVRLRVLKVNLRALVFYQRLGFICVDETDTHVLMEMEKMIAIQRMTAEDISRVSEIMCSCYQWLGRENGFSDKQVDFLVSERGSVATIKAESQSQTYFVACINDGVVGVAAVNANEVTKIFVDPNCHGKGIGAMLFNSAQQAIIKAGCKEMVAGVMAHSAIGFYEKMGMSKFDEKILQSGTFAGCKTPLMRKVLLHA